MTTVNSVGSTTGIVFAAQAAPGAMTVAKALSTLKLQPGSTVLVYCRSGRRSASRMSSRTMLVSGTSEVGIR